MSPADDNKMSVNTLCTFRVLLSWRFPRKTASLDKFSPPPRPLKNAIFILIVVSLSLSLERADMLSILPLLSTSPKDFDTRVFLNHACRHGFRHALQGSFREIVNFAHS